MGDLALRMAERAGDSLRWRIRLGRIRPPSDKQIKAARSFLEMLDRPDFRGLDQELQAINCYWIIMEINPNWMVWRDEFGGRYLCQYQKVDAMGGPDEFGDIYSHTTIVPKPNVKPLSRVIPRLRNWATQTLEIAREFSPEPLI